ncbi:hypothetical protein AB0C02_30440 [Micromonospora sp. NPDC048999]|uniref:hypothetical protein n=1 Tax=Micromonospora sp. NPDC048999 TaxID=3155391 RepID=UPI0033F17308
MDLPPLAPLAALAGRLGYTPEGAEATRAENRLADASALIRDEAGKTWAVGGQLVDVPHRVAGICVDVALRAFTNPEALSQRSIGDSNKSYDRAGLDGGAIVYLTDAEAKAVRKAAGGNGFRSVTVVSPWSGDGESLLGS